MKPNILQIVPLLRSTEQALDSEYEVHRIWLADDQADLLREVGPRIRAVATDGHAGIPLNVLNKLPVLEMISSFGVGYDAIDVSACKARDIRVANTPDVLNDAVAEITLGLMIALARRLPQADAYVRKGLWEKGNFELTGELTGTHAGILGLGRIGKEIARRLQAMKMKVSYCGRHEQPYQPFDYYSDLTEMARAVDWLVVIAPGSPETRGIVSREVMEALGPQGMLVNVARGSLVDERAMVALLASGGLGGAALDVFAAEPSVPNGLWGLDNVVLSPHQGSATHKTREAMGDLVVKNLAAHFAGDPLITPVA